MTAGGLPQDATWRYFYNKRDSYSSGTPAYYKVSAHINDKRDVDIVDDIKFYKNYGIGVKIEYWIG